MTLNVFKLDITVNLIKPYYNIFGHFFRSLISNI